jgi:serine/threonine protein kinase
VTQGVHSGPGDLAPGDQIAGYEILDQIGRGGMAVVYRALDLRLGRTVALKVLAPELGEDQAFRQRFIRESRAAAGVDHPHIIPVYEAGESAGVLFIAMRYVGGGDVRLLIEAEGRLSPSRVAEITSQAASALDAAHAHGLVHRDVKPGNMLLGQASSSGHDHMYLSDFGLSKDSLNPQTLTSTGQFFGTLDYVSPEQIQGHPVDGRADQYALACTAVEMLTGAPPFERTDTMALMWAQLHAAPPRLTDRRPELQPVVDQVIARALAKSAASRYPSCSAFAEALTAAFAEARDLAPPTAQSSPVQPMAADEPWPRRPRGWPSDDRLAPDSMAGTTRTAGPGWEGRSAAGGSRPVPPRISRSPAGEPELAQNFLTPGTPATDSRPRQPQPPRPAAYQQGTWPQQPGRTSPSRGRPTRHTGRTVAITLLVLLFVAAVAFAVAYRLAHRTDASTPPPAATTTITVPPKTDAATIVREFFALINEQRYYAAWQLTPQTESYQAFAAGYAQTKRDVLRIQKVTDNVVTAHLTALQTNGPTKYYEGTYTVTNGKISGADVQQVG